MTLGGVLLLLGALLVIRVPIAFALGITAWLYMWAGGVDLRVLAQQVANGPDNWILLAMPLFVLAGLLMNTAGISDRIFGLARALVGHIRGGLGLVNVVDSMLFGGLSGSAVADSAALGSVILPAMKKEGYPPAFSAALTSSTASIGIIIPPSIPMIIYGAVAGVSVGALFIAGIVPGILVGLGQGAVVYGIARSRGWGGDHRFSWRGLARAARDAWLALVMPVIILGGIMFSVFTPTEAGAVAVVYGVLIGFWYRTLTLRTLYRALVDSAVLTAMVMILVSTSLSLGWVLSHERVPQLLTAWFVQLTRDPTLLLLVLTVLLIVAGCLLHGDPIMLLIVPILLPAVKALGIDLLHFGMIVVFTVAIGQQTPPVGSTLFVVSALSGRGIMEITAANLPFILVITAIMYILLFVPQLVLFLPRLAGLG
ncbi:MAG: TRAP transporter large permease [Candidatus Rokuibacteriota bacterium]